ncbi:PPE family protein, partial [Mycobacterium marinum]
MNFSVLPPEVNSALIFTGPGAEPMRTAATAWGGMAVELESAADSFASVTSGLVGGAWQGASSVAMGTAAASYLGWLNAAAAHAEQAAAQAEALVAEFAAAQSAMVQPFLLAANRSSLVSLVLSNLFGQNAPAIAAVEAEYEQMWALDVSTMATYHAGASAAAASLTPLAQPLQNLSDLPGRVIAAFGNGAPATTVTAAVTALRLPADASTVNFGLANIGSGNVGNANNGIGNLGSGNLGNFNLGSGNLGSSNAGWANLGSNNIGGANSGGNNLGWGNLGGLNTGFANAGSGNFGFANTGNNNIGIGLTGDNQVGIGG